MHSRRQQNLCDPALHLHWQGKECDELGDVGKRKPHNGGKLQVYAEIVDQLDGRMRINNTGMGARRSQDSQNVPLGPDEDLG